MSTKAVIYTGMIIGSTVGGFIPMLWGASMLDFSSILLSAVGGIAGIVVGYKLVNGGFY